MKLHIILEMNEKLVTQLLRANRLMANQLVCYAENLISKTLLLNLCKEKPSKAQR